MDEFATARRAAVVRCFIDALTRGGPAGTPRPIELHSHDPLRYLGDMLAWLHQAAASEHEHLLALLKCSSKIGESKTVPLLCSCISVLFVILDRVRTYSLAAFCNLHCCCLDEKDAWLGGDGFIFMN